METRREHLQNATHSREQLHDVRLAATRDGIILALDDRFLLDQGVYNPWGIVQPYDTVGHMLGPFRVPHARFEGKSVVTNKTPHASYRGAGRPEAVFVMDRMVDRLARTVGIDPAEARRRNFIRSDEMPYDVGMFYRDGNPLVYDGGDFHATLEAALEASGYRAIRDEQAALRDRAVHRGVGISSYVEGTGIGPFEGAVVWLDPSGKVLVSSRVGRQVTTFWSLRVAKIRESSAERFARGARAPGVRLARKATRCRQAASLINSAHRSPERPDDSRPAGAGHPHVPAIGAAVELAATPMLLKESVQVVKQAGHGRQCSSEGGREPWVAISRGRCATGRPRRCARSATGRPVLGFALSRVLLASRGG